jgi:hypothetical protein
LLEGIEPPPAPGFGEVLRLERQARDLGYAELR